MAHAPIIHTLLAGMWTGYRRWMSLFNTLSILLSVVLAVVILGFAFGVRGYVDTTIRKEAAAGAGPSWRLAARGKEHNLSRGDRGGR